MLRLRFHASWLPSDHNQFWTLFDCTNNIKTIHDLIEFFNEQQKSLADYYNFDISKRSTKLKYLKAFINDCVLPPNAQANHILRDNDEIHFRLEIDAQNQWLLVKAPPSLKRKRSIEPDITPSSPPSEPAPAPPSTNDLDSILRTMAKPIETNSPEQSSFTFQFGNKRGRPIPPRPQVISAVKVNSLVPRQVIKRIDNKT
ncbi:unnamed protein product [Rotaria magnacalcarata]|uniref:Uncharacterized protein n=2 Tax=Rotaria magnacalcarata TaxID=392030 RepID=A0A816MX75_9BILA|nr:unnamed protein product [Rotaria magnacalcarata]CAF1300035.1 unnamed protein product [Rotaria magnacalcarata]CAF2017181.1 unnamed protein product [Rotaria magnacalcarata]CAF2058373.1 unnamed protein product [Rotaria magnacalcarata]CAF2144405.1 unnamed protein product [Rotaria magnacalcarata]